MKSSKKDVENAILVFAKICKKEDSYKAIIESDAVLPKIVELIVYDMFLEKINPYFIDNEQYEQYKLLLEYALELKTNGWVTFDSLHCPYPYPSYPLL